MVFTSLVLVQPSPKFDITEKRYKPPLFKAYYSISKALWKEDILERLHWTFGRNATSNHSLVTGHLHLCLACYPFIVHKVANFPASAFSTTTNRIRFPDSKFALFSALLLQYEPLSVYIATRNRRQQRAPKPWN
jgi:hypothetical protein